MKKENAKHQIPDESIAISILTPLLTRLNKYILFLCNEDGQILKLFSRSQRQQNLAKFLEEHTVQELLGEEASVKISVMAAVGKPISIIRKFRAYDTAEDYYTSLPEAGLNLFELRSGLYAGLVTFSDLSPAFYHERRNHFLHINQQGLLKGFNETFYSLFRAQYPSPSDLLDRPVEELFSPSPLQVQKEYLQKQRDSSLDQAPLVFEHDCRAMQSEIELAPEGTGRVMRMDSGLVYSNPGDRIDFISLPPELDLRKQDFSLEMTVTLLKGHDPVFMIFEARDNPSPAITEEAFLAYLAGRQPDGPRSFIKKSGFVAHSGAYLDIAAEPKTLTLRKCGWSLSLFLNQRKLLSWYDVDFLQLQKARLAIGLRPGCECLLAGIGLRVQERAEPTPPGRVLVRLEDETQRTFTLNRFYTYALSSAEAFRDTAAYFLLDVTDIQGRIEDLTRDIKTHVKQEEELRTQLERYEGRETAFLGRSAVIEAVRERALTLADSRVTVLIEGETGTGKEVLAHYIHRHSPFREGPFIKVDCSTLPRDLMESELFGHEAGAFTGALRRKTGLIEQAEGGTLFIDEVANLTPDAQKKLLHFLQDFTITRVGGGRPLRLDLRVIAASNVPLSRMVEENAFRSDLFHRLFVAGLAIPPLRDRKEDLSELCDHFLRTMAETARKEIRTLSPGAYRKLHDHPWPGNVRELRNVIQRAVLFCKGSEVTEKEIELLAPPLPHTPSEAAGPSTRTELNKAQHTDRRPFAGMTREKLEALLGETGGSVAELSRRMKVSPRGLYAALKRLKINPEEIRNKQPAPGNGSQGL